MAGIMTKNVFRFVEHLKAVRRFFTRSSSRHVQNDKILVIVEIINSIINRLPSPPGRGWGGVIGLCL